MPSTSRRRALAKLTGLPAAAFGVMGAALLAQASPAAATFGSIPDFHRYCPSAHSGSLYVRRTNRNGFAPRCRRFGTEHDVDARAICRWWSGSSAHHWVRNRREERIQLHCNGQKTARANTRPGPNPARAHGGQPAEVRRREEATRRGRAAKPGRASYGSSLRDCGVAFTGGDYGQVPTPCPGLRGGQRVRLEGLHYVNGRRCSLAWKGRIPVERCPYPNRTATVKYSLHGACWQHWYRTRGYDWHRPASIPESVRAERKNTVLFTRFVHRQLTCFFMSRAAYRAIVQRSGRSAASLRPRGKADVH